MAGDTANAVLSAVAEKMITPALEAIGRQFGYLFLYKSNIKNLEKKVIQLENARDDADNFFKAQSRNNEERAHSSVGWLNDVEEVNMAAKQVVEAKHKLGGWCLNLKGRYVLSRKSTKLVAEIRKLQDQAPVRVSTNPSLPAGLLPGSSSNYASKDFKTRAEIVERVMEALKDDKINIIGICGLGGIGKTTILHEVRERARSQNLFDEVAMTTVSQDQNMFKIQSDLACMLGFTSINGVENMIARADLLHKRLTNGSTILVVLDDIWSEIKLEEIGIPVGNGHARCKVVIASRIESVCSNMTQKTIPVDALSKEEAWNMFKKTAGDCLEREKLEEIAKQVADECGGLPIALVTLASALSNKKRVVWEDARRQLTQSGLTRIPGMNKKVYSSLMLSYNFLKEELPEAQPLLLLCCQYPEDAEIEVEKLARYCVALELFKKVHNVEDTRNRTYAVIDHLKSCFLLQVVDVVREDEKYFKYETVKMHDVVRDVCLSIVSEVKEERDKVYMHIMAQDRNGGQELGTSEVYYPKLKLLMEAPFDGSLLDISLLQQMKELRVFENNRFHEQHSPPALQVLSNLRMLSLEHNLLSEEIMSTIGSLSKLEILSFWGSYISSIPRQIGQLSNLKLLDLRCIKGEGLIPSGILLGLKKLEVLCMGEFLLLGAAKDKDIRNGESHGLITELDSLSNLTNLQIILKDPNDLLYLQRFRFENLKTFFFGPSSDISFNYSSRLCTIVINTIILGNFAGMKWVLGAKIQPIASSTVDLQLKDIEDWTDPLILEKFFSLENLVLENCKQLEYVTPVGSLRELQRLVLRDMAMMRCLLVGPINPLYLGKLIKVEIYNCPEMESMFPHSAAKCLVQLQHLKITKCPKLEGIFSEGKPRITSTSRGAEIKEETLNDFIVMFPKLEELSLSRLPKLGGFYNLKLEDGMVQQPFLNPLVMLPSFKKLGCESIHELKQIVGSGGMLNLAASDWLQNLDFVFVGNCDSLETVFDFEGLHVMGENARVPTFGKLKYIELMGLPNLEHLCRQIPQGVHAFQNLGGLYVTNCDKLGYLISTSMAHSLVNLGLLRVENCKSMNEVIKTNEECSAEKIVFRSLSRLILRNLEKISFFCSSDQQSFEFPSLGEVIIQNCSGMETFCCGHVTADNLHGVKMSFGPDSLVWKGDLNETVRHLNARNKVNQMNSDLKEDDVPKDDRGSISSPPLEKDTPTKALMPPPSVVSSPNASLTPAVVCPSPRVSDNNEELVDSSSSDVRKVGLPPLVEFVPSASTEQSVHSSDSPVQSKAGNYELSDMSLSSRDDDWKRSRTLIQGVYVKVELKTTFEEIMAAKPNFLSGFRLKMERVRTEVIESAIHSLEILRQRTALTISSEELTYIKDSLNDLETSGLDTAWLERGYQRAILLMKEKKVVSAAAQLAMLEREKTQDEATFQMAKAKLEATTARRDTFKAEYDALIQELEARKELFGGGFDLETSLGDGLLD